jgi:protein transport protein SEC13
MMIPTTSTDEQQQPIMEPQVPRIATAGCNNCVRFYVGNVVGEQWTLEYITPSSTSSSSTNNKSSVVGHTDWVRDVAWAPCLLPNYNTVASCSEDRTVIIWTQDMTTVNDENNSNSDRATTTGEWVGTVMHTFDEPVWRVSWSITGHLLAVSSGDSTVTMWKASVHDRTKYIQVPTASDSSNVGAE